MFKKPTLPANLITRTIDLPKTQTVLYFSAADAPGVEPCPTGTFARFQTPPHPGAQYGAQAIWQKHPDGWVELEPLLVNKADDPPPAAPKPIKSRVEPKPVGVIDGLSGGKEPEALIYIPAREEGMALRLHPDILQALAGVLDKVPVTGKVAIGRFLFERRDDYEGGEFSQWEVLPSAAAGPWVGKRFLGPCLNKEVPLVSGSTDQRAFSDFEAPPAAPLPAADGAASPRADLQAERRIIDQQLSPAKGRAERMRSILGAMKTLFEPSQHAPALHALVDALLHETSLAVQFQQVAVHEMVAAQRSRNEAAISARREKEGIEARLLDARELLLSVWAELIFARRNEAQRLKKAGGKGPLAYANTLVAAADASEKAVRAKAADWGLSDKLADALADAAS